MTEKINWAKVMLDNREAIEEKIREAKEEAYDCMQGWHIDVEIDEAGKAWTSELFSSGSQSMSSWKGETYIVCGINSWDVEVNEQEEIRYDQELYSEYLAQKDDDDGYEEVWRFMQEKHPDTLEEWHKDAKDCELNEFDPSEILDQAIKEF